MGRLERQLAELVAGHDGGWALWMGALAALEMAIAKAREDPEMFGLHARVSLRRLLVDVEAALDSARLAVDVRELLVGHQDAPVHELEGRIADVLLERVREVSLAKGLPLTNEDAFGDQRR